MIVCTPYAARLKGAPDAMNFANICLLNIQPPITIRSGFPVRVIVSRDHVLAPHQS